MDRSSTIGSRKSKTHGLVSAVFNANLRFFVLSLLSLDMKVFPVNFESFCARRSSSTGEYVSGTTRETRIQSVPLRIVLGAKFNNLSLGTATLQSLQEPFHPTPAQVLREESSDHGPKNGSEQWGGREGNDSEPPLRRWEDIRHNTTSISQ